MLLTSTQAVGHSSIPDSHISILERIKNGGIAFMKQARAKGIVTMVFPDGASFVAYKLDDNGQEVERIHITLTSNDLEHLAAAYAAIKRQSEHNR